MRRGSWVFSGDYGENRGDPGMDEAEAGELGFTFPDSKANFIFATHKTVPAQELFENLKTAGIYVRYFKKPRIDNYLRITVGTQAEMERLVEVLAELVK